VKNDISVPVAALPALLTRGETALREIVPDARIVAFGHAGDGNVHFNVVQNQGDDPAALMDKAEAIMDCVNEVTAALGGSFAAEHGIGLVKRAAFQRFRDDVERDMMRRIRGALDPDGLLNPGKIFQ
jgi:FAD/FMN-containing dehydrogenase